ncbi:MULTISPECIES: grasp-with-spasm system ATP-grasp peptide maturase [unclassified Chryseobacterium]|uniref:grasp-with-spasm system ATP-grasp peptide maturase n=1 Tax=unclassified Chryseobacterium TaxID=2593645 RepID=UPI000F452093|nr:grasp-with-spasm system ATP-grasp peptide maturase [Chryseobacterium sp. G0240]ROI03704.1 grasp-with-spasm system ATP-grasp peptide maturase [Chryseobacterium sp. G0240]
MILIFTIQNDFSTSNVIKWLTHYGEKVVRINSDDELHKLFKIDNEGIFFKNTRTSDIINLLDAKSCWWRRNGISKNSFLHDYGNQEFIVNDFNLTSIKKDLISNEAEDLKNFIYYSVYHNTKINLGRPKFNLNKLITMKVAENCGLKVPEYEIITDTNQIRHNDLSITKAISNGIYKVVNNYSFYSYTELIEYEKDVKVPVFPSLKMDLIKKTMEIRVFFIEGQFFSMAIFSQSSDQTSVDFRKYNHKKPNKVEPYKLPALIEEKITKIFKELGLNCGSVDLILDDQNEFVFLEINPVGQYGMVSDPCNYSLDKTIAKYLINGRITEN